ncbi:MAG: hypothetical protein HY236_05865 [Acidobacteria bacterium]|nr:hypothetical protein [Acidobacteriota bacterium]
MKNQSARGIAYWGRWLAAILCAPVICISNTGSTTQNLSAQINPIGKLSVTAGIPLTTSATTFIGFSGTLPVSYRVRTTPGGGGAITMQATSDFAPAGGPSLSTGALPYTCGSASLGTSCSGAQTVSKTAQTPVLTVPGGVCTGGGGACSASDPNSVTVNFSLTNDPQFQTGAFAASLMFTIIAT